MPFVGRAGQLLDKIFAAVTLDTNRHCYVTNVVKRRPANNRDPTVGEIAYYRDYLQEEIRLVDPALIVLTGRHSMRALVRRGKGGGEGGTAGGGGSVFCIVQLPPKC